MAYPFFKEDKVDGRTQLTFTGTRLEIYVPSYYLLPTEELAQVIGNKIQSLGILFFKADGKLFELQIPVNIMFEFSEQYKEKLRLKPSLPIMEYDVFVLVKNDTFIYDLYYKQSFDDIMMWISKLVQGAKLPPTLPYSEVFSLYVKALQVTNINANLGIPALSIEFILSELYRNKRNLTRPFRFAYNGTNEYDYRMIKITKVPEMNSTFTALLGEDIKQQLVSSIAKFREGRVDRVSPMEKIIKY
jgi:hypothetical protein